MDGPNFSSTHQAMIGSRPLRERGPAAARPDRTCAAIGRVALPEILKRDPSAWSPAWLTDQADRSNQSATTSFKGCNYDQGEKL
jgi:hypothetical protein